MAIVKQLNSIRLDETYEYVCGIPIDCLGELYMPRLFVLDVPSYQQKVLVEALSGKDKGLWFVCSLANFAVRYKLHVALSEPTPTQETSPA